MRGRGPRRRRRRAAGRRWGWRPVAAAPRRRRCREWRGRISRLQLLECVGGDPAGSARIDFTDLSGGGDGGTAQARAALADFAQRPVYALLDEVAIVGGGFDDQRE